MARNPDVTGSRTKSKSHSEQKQRERDGPHGEVAKVAALSQPHRVATAKSA
jgi:hypothetical protein